MTKHDAPEEASDRGREGRIDRLVKDFEAKVTSHLNENYANTTKWSDKFADKIAQFGGSWRFINVFFGILIFWIVFNSLSLTKVIHFDESPFILLNLVLSFLAGFQAPIIMMSQNRQSARDKHESIIDYAINYKAEKEIHTIQKHLAHLEQRFAEVELLAFKSEMRAELAEIKQLLLERK
ncbi:DUF1003 domain-containing protein [Paenibacillus agricola]|uniref:DUF1003 domain-containing protein n=1 Tax=Paenibacillus agricola TaxID=2716264 RepID=A0ABX0JCD4_9BACL|nr:DUF1003 domain-containing protein [Paenibacillus agricola]NHN32899.1 DUF1003 domain-containing protein [Paenibacillus agricola]